MEDTQDTNKEKTEVPAKFKKIVDEIESMSALDLNELVKTFENKFGVSATAVAAGPVRQGSGHCRPARQRVSRAADGADPDRKGLPPLPP